tara:strand:- start:122 stop:448 length:327 start_codon:yes stop_codon:yes gene_type:complete
MWDKIISWGIGQFTKNFMGGGKDDGGSFWEKMIGAGASAIGDKFLDTPSGAGRPPNVDLGVKPMQTYAMSDAKAPDTPEVADYVTIEAKWTKIAKKLAEIEDTSSRVG